MSAPLSGLPRVGDAALPRDVRQGSAADKEAYRTAVGFERVLVEQVVKAATRTQALAEGPHGDAVQGALADAMSAGGGLGLARQLYELQRDGSPS